MAEAGERVGTEGPEGEKWAKWLVKDKEELEGIKSPELRTEIRLLARRPDSMVNPDTLSKTYERIDDLLREKKIDDADAALWQGRIGKRHEDLVAKETTKEVPVEHLERIAKATEASAKATRRATGEILEELPKEKDEQRRLIIGLVEQIESNDLPIAPLPDIFTLADRAVMQRISSLVEQGDCDPEVRREAMARLRLQHCYAIASSIPGKSEDAAGFLFNVFRQPESKRWVLEGEDFDLFLKEGINGLDIGEAFEQLQDAYTRRGSKNLGAKNLSPEEIESIYREIEDRLGGNKNARTSLKLAQRIAKATLETSIWNKELSGADPLAEAIYFRRYRTSRLGQVRDRGPDITIDRIAGFGTSYFRYAQTLDKIEGENGEEKNAYLFLADKNHHPAFLTKVQSAKDRISKTLERIRGGLEFRVDGGKLKDDGFKKDFLLNIQGLEYESLKPGDYQGWLSINVTRILAFKSLLLQTSWKPEDFNSDAIEGYVAPSDTADPEQVLRLRPEFILGVLYSIYSRPNEATNLGWDTVALKGALDNLTREVEVAEGETKPAYISKAQLDWVIKVLRWAHIDIWHEAAMVSVRRVVSTRVK